MSNAPIDEAALEAHLEALSELPDGHLFLTATDAFMTLCAVQREVTAQVLVEQVEGFAELPYAKALKIVEYASVTAMTLGAKAYASLSRPISEPLLRQPLAYTPLVEAMKATDEEGSEFNLEFSETSERLVYLIPMLRFIQHLGVATLEELHPGLATDKEMLSELVFHLALHGAVAEFCCAKLQTHEIAAH